jgi:hypothetical protein
MRTSRVRAGLGVLCLASLVILPAAPSDPVGIYALVDRVILQPDTVAPQRIPIWGASIRGCARRRHRDE